MINESEWQEDGSNLIVYDCVHKNVLYQKERNSGVYNSEIKELGGLVPSESCEGELLPRLS